MKENKNSICALENKVYNIGYFKVFGCKYFILNIKENLENFDSKFNIEIFLGYSSTSKAYWVFNKRTLVVKESMKLIFYEATLDQKKDIVNNVGLEIPFEQRYIQHQNKIVNINMTKRKMYNKVN